LWLGWDVDGGTRLDLGTGPSWGCSTVAPGGAPDPAAAALTMGAGGERLRHRVGDEPGAGRRGPGRWRGRVGLAGLRPWTGSRPRPTPRRSPAAHGSPTSTGTHYTMAVILRRRSLRHSRGAGDWRPAPSLAGDQRGRAREPDRDVRLRMKRAGADPVIRALSAAFLVRAAARAGRGPWTQPDEWLKDQVTIKLGKAASCGQGLGRPPGSHARRSALARQGLVDCPRRVSPRRCARVRIPRWGLAPQSAPTGAHWSSIPGRARVCWAAWSRVRRDRTTSAERRATRPGVAAVGGRSRWQMHVAQRDRCAPSAIGQTPLGGLR